MLLYETKTMQNVDAELKLQEDKANQDEGVAGEEVLEQRSLKFKLNLLKRSYGRKNGKPYKTI